jgi:hypothetical protein
MAIKCVAQIPHPVATPANASQATRRGGGPPEQTDRYNARQKTNTAGEYDQAEIVLASEAT